MNISKYIILIIILLSNSQFGYSQVCGGNLGENIFTNGNFGSGSNNIFQFNPQIAPGYNYAWTNPVNDGEYTLTNSTVPWTGINGWGWVRTGDDSPNPEGYMMLVNASYDTGLFYQQIISDLCENSLFEFRARILNLVEAGSNKIRPNVSFQIDGVTVYSTGDIPENEKWNTYGFTFTTQPGQTQVTLALRNNAGGGIGNDLAIDNISFRACGPAAVINPQQTAFICEDSAIIQLDATVSGNQYTTPQFQWQQSFDEGINWSDIPGETSPIFNHVNNIGGYYFYRYLLANSLQNLNNPKCRINSNPKTIRVTPKFTTVFDTICEGLSVKFGLNTFSQSGSYTDSLFTKAGCDSIVTLKLFVIPDRGIKTKFEIINPSCTGDSDGQMKILSVEDGTPEFKILLDTVDISDSRIVENMSAGIYSIHIQDRYQCEMDTFFEILDPSPFIVDLGENQKKTLGETFTIYTTSNEIINTYSWNSSLVSCVNDCQEVEVKVLSNQWISLTATSLNNCKDQDSIFLEVDNSVKELFIPNVFTPNSDSYNDYFEVTTEFPNSIKNIESLIIYDRWGQIVYEEKNIPSQRLSNLWDGKRQDKKVLSGYYFYKLGIRYLDNDILIYNGQIQIIR